ncbi:hypothetical protein [Actinomadura parmotrematis]|uniref:Uncharacterized protein n=1 Tax=Actinomadura parmotrematis TaxID=2864039 RepID=A0ABS7FS71_9ACTN|nr:hypothetical protein [Actinomadura parmotrematis]MBW8482412.1 hypothetical protein [Actinomadura parmotrematis]
MRTQLITALAAAATAAATTAAAPAAEASPADASAVTCGQDAPQIIALDGGAPAAPSAPAAPAAPAASAGQAGGEHVSLLVQCGGGTVKIISGGAAPPPTGSTPPGPASKEAPAAPGRAAPSPPAAPAGSTASAWAESASAEGAHAGSVSVGLGDDEDDEDAAGKKGEATDEECEAGLEKEKKITYVSSGAKAGTVEYEVTTAGAGGASVRHVRRSWTGDASAGSGAAGSALRDVLLAVAGGECGRVQIRFGPAGKLLAIG